jgi:hypothetical protein
MTTGFVLSKLPLYTNELQASVAGNIVFKNNAGTTVGTVSDAGAWALGPDAGVATAVLCNGALSLKTTYEINDAGGKYVKIKGGNGATAVATGYVGEKREFTARTIAAVTTSWTAHASALDTLPAGRWQVHLYANLTGASGATLGEFTIATNTADDATGFYSMSGITLSGTGNTSGSTASGWRFYGGSFIVEIASSLALYAKAVSTGANRNIQVFGYAIRIN